MRQVKRIRPATAFPFTLGVFTGTLITAFLCLALRSIDDDGARVDVIDAAIVKMPAVPHEEAKEKRQPPYEEGKLPLVPMKLVSYNVIGSRWWLKTRGLAIHHTWGSEMKNLDFYLFPPLDDEELNFAYRRRIPVVSLGFKKSLHKNDEETDDFQGVFKTWKDICQQKQNNYQWFVKLQDSVYIRAKELEVILGALNSSEPLFIGHSITPIGNERDELGLREGENYCLEMGYVVSRRTLELVCPKLEVCQANARSENEDVEVARCIRIYAGINCTTANEMKELFYHAQGVLAQEELQLGAPHLNPSVKTAIALSPLLEPDHFYHLHHYYSEQKFNSSKAATIKLRAHMIQTAEKGAAFDSLEHMTEHQTPLWTKLGVNSPFLSSKVEDIIHWQNYDNQYKYTEAKFYPSHPISALDKRDMNEVFKAITHTAEDDEVVVDSILQRLDSQRGIDYFLHTIQRDSEDQYQARFLHALRESEPPRVTSLTEAAYKTTKVNFVVPTPPVSRAFQRFMMSFENSFLARKPPELVGLLVILYSDGKFRHYDKDIFAAVTLLDLYKKKYPKADLRLISTRRPYSRKESIELASKEHPTYELLFLADIHIDFSMQFLERCRMNALEDQQVYFPAVFSPYNPGAFYKTRVRYPYATRFQITEEQGSWMHESFHLTCVYNYDLVEVLELGEDLKESEWNLLNLFIQYGKLTIFRAVEPGLVHLWQDGCNEEELGEKEKDLCQKLESVLAESESDVISHVK